MRSEMILPLALLVPLSMATPLSIFGRSTGQVVNGVNGVPSINNNDGVGAGSSNYVFYKGDGSTAQGWPAKTQWVSFSNMWTAYQPILTQSCGWNGWGANNNADEIQAIYNSIQSIALSTKLDHRFIFAVLLQESKGCVRAPTTGNGVRNPGLMQSHNGAYTCNDPNSTPSTPLLTPCPTSQINGMIQDGSGGTTSGDGLAGTLNIETQAGYTGAQAFYRAARRYNSGSVSADGNLGNGLGSTNCYASDITNRLMGWNDLASSSTCNL